MTNLIHENTALESLYAARKILIDTPLNRSYPSKADLYDLRKHLENAILKLDPAFDKHG